MTAHGNQNTIITTDKPEFPWLHDEKLYAVPLNNKFITTDQIIANMINQIVQLQHASNESHLGVSFTSNWGGNNTPSAGPYELIASSAYDFTLINMEHSVGNGGGSFRVSIFNNGSPIEGLEDVLIDSQQRQMVLTGPNQIIRRNAEMIMTVHDIVGFPLNSWVSFNGTTNAFSEPVIGVTTGNAIGMCTVVAIGTSVASNQGLGLARGLAIVQATGIASSSAVGTAIGAANANAHGVQVALGASAGFAQGAAIVNGVGTSTVSEHVFVMDDPQFGRLDINPLG